MIPSPSDSSHTDHRFPFRLCVAFVLAGAVILIGMAAYVTHSFQVADEVFRLESTLKKLSASIVHLDEVLTMSARMAAYTGDPEWEARYRHFEPVLDHAIKECIRLAPETYEGQMAQQTDAANIKLVEMEHQAFEYVRQGQLADAQTLLLGVEYGVQKDLYAQGIATFTQSITAHASSILDQLRVRVRQSILIVFTGLALLLFGWAWVLWTMWKWDSLLLRQNRELDTQAAQLSQLNIGLDQKVAERTAALEQAVETLHAAVAKRDRVELELRDANASFQQKVKELELLNHVMLGREERIMELKAELKTLRTQLRPDQT